MGEIEKAPELTVASRAVGVCRACRSSGPVVLLNTPEGPHSLSMALCVDCALKVGDEGIKLRNVTLGRQMIEFSTAMGKLHVGVEHIDE